VWTTAYLHEHERALFAAQSVEVERDGRDRQRLSVDVLDLTDEPGAHVEVEDEVGVVGVALVAVDVITHTRPAALHRTAPTCTRYKQVAREF